MRNNMEISMDELIADLESWFQSSPYGENWTIDKEPGLRECLEKWDKVYQLDKKIMFAIIEITVIEENYRLSIPYMDRMAKIYSETSRENVDKRQQILNKYMKGNVAAEDYLKRKNEDFNKQKDRRISELTGQIQLLKQDRKILNEENKLLREEIEAYRKEQKNIPGEAG